MRDQQPRFCAATRTRRFEVLPGLLVLAALSTPLRASPQEVPRVEHGAADMTYQMGRLDAIVPIRDWRDAPPGVDALMWSLSVPAGNEATLARVALGRKLYFDKRLSLDDTVSCATCHDVTRGFTDLRPVSEGIHGKLGRRNAPTTLNSGLIEPLFWDGRARNLEHQAGMPILNPVEMGMPDEAAVVKKLSSIPEYRQAFRDAYGSDVNYEDLQRALAAFQRTLVFLDAPFDAFLAGDEHAISEDAKAGWALFNGKARCVGCHPINTTNLLGTNELFHNVGVSARHQDFEGLARKALSALDRDDSEIALDVLALSTDMSELGRFMVTRNRSDIGAFRTPQLRNVGVTGPYMHDGSMQTLWDVMDHYNKGGEDNAFLDGGIEALALTEPEIDQLVELLFTMTDRRLSELNDEQHALQKERAATQRTFRDEKLASRRVLGFEERVMKGGK